MLCVVLLTGLLLQEGVPVSEAAAPARGVTPAEQGGPPAADTEQADSGPRRLQWARGEVRFALWEVTEVEAGEEELGIRILGPRGTVVVPWSPLVDGTFQASLEPGGYVATVAPRDRFADTNAPRWTAGFGAVQGTVVDVRLLPLKRYEPKLGQLKLRLSWTSNEAVPLSHVVVWDAHFLSGRVLAADERHTSMPIPPVQSSADDATTLEWISQPHHFTEKFNVRVEPQGWTFPMEAGDLDRWNEFQLGRLEPLPVLADARGEWPAEPEWVQVRSCVLRAATDGDRWVRADLRGSPRLDVRSARLLAPENCKYSVVVGYADGVELRHVTLREAAAPRSSSINGRRRIRVQAVDAAHGLPVVPPEWWWEELKFATADGKTFPRSWLQQGPDSTERDATMFLKGDALRLLVPRLLEPRVDEIDVTLTDSPEVLLVFSEESGWSLGAPTPPSTPAPR